jgi:hypothetical protein
MLVTSVNHYDYARKRLWEALYALVGDGPMRKRLAGARKSLTGMVIEDELPEELHEEYNEIMHYLNERLIHFSFKSSEINARAPGSGAIARRILGLYTRVRGGM